jgi:predicted RNA-binding Zn-ribbon protein involved in translation (DUF1610 family)
MAIKTFSTYSDTVEANIALSKLQANDIACFLTNEQMNDLMWHMKVGLGGVRLMLHDYDFEQANEILALDSITITEEPSGDISCPNCGANNVKAGPQTKDKLGVIGGIKLFFSLIFLTPVPIQTTAYHCFNCEFEFDE